MAVLAIGTRSRGFAISSIIRHCRWSSDHSTVGLNQWRGQLQLQRQRSSTTAESASSPSTKNGLLKFFVDKIRATGPITVHEYMKTCIASYYSQLLFDSDQEIFGDGGDFVTSPELSQMFGEIIGVWCYYELSNAGHKGAWNLVEVGPGTGELSSDVLRVLHHFKENNFSLCLVETSEAQVKEQHKTLCGRNEIVRGQNSDGFLHKSVTDSGIDVYWYSDVSHLPEVFSVFVANEFLDALPVHQFKRVGPDEKDWREVFVDIDHANGSISNDEDDNNDNNNNNNNNNKLRFCLTKSENIHTSAFLPKNIRTNAELDEYEMCPEAGKFVSLLAERMVSFGGIALLIDYGHNGDRTTFSLRAYSRHEQTDPLECPGLHDLTADVNFDYLKSVVEDRLLAEVDTVFLDNMGMSLRLQKLLIKCKTGEERENLIKSYQFLVSDQHMGTKFKAIALFPKTLEPILQARGGPSGFAANIRKRAQSKSTE